MMALTNAQKQQRWRTRNVIVLTHPGERIAAMLIDMPDQAKLRAIARKVNAHLKRNSKLSRSEKEQAKLGRLDKRAWRDLWIACGRSAEDFARLWTSDSGDGELWAFRRAIGSGDAEATRLAWLRAHPGKPWIEHECSMTDAEHARYQRWLARWVRSREHADLYANPHKLLALAETARRESHKHSHAFRGGPGMK